MDSFKKFCSECRRNPPNPGYSLCETCYQAKKNTPLCSTCQKTPANQGYSLCETCYQASKRSNLGVTSCEICNQPANKGYTLCELCYQIIKIFSSLCSTCKQNPPNPGYSLCEGCYQASKRSNLGVTSCKICNRPANKGYTWCELCYQKIKKFSSLCSTCKRNPPNPGYSLCETCYQAKKNAPLCSTCQKTPANQGYSLCETCYQASKNGGKSLCKICNKRAPNQGYTWCDPCYQKKNSKLCRKCKSTSANHGFTLCQACYDKKHASNSNGDVIFVPLPSSKKQSVAKQFVNTWAKSHISHQIVDIVGVQNASSFARYNKYKASVASNRNGDPNERRRWHGTKMECKLHKTKKPCNSPSCSICNICKTGFQIKYATTNYAGRFGKGLYFAPNSSKSEAYSKSSGDVRAMFLCKVVVGKVYKTQVDMPNLSDAPNNCDSVSGEVGQALNFPELVVYKSDAALAAYIVFFK